MMGTIIAANGNTLQQIIAPPGSNKTTSNPDDVDSKVNATATEIPHPTTEVNGFLVHGLLLMERGYIFTCMILAAASACLIDRKFIAASIWMFAASLLTFLGAMHAYQVYGGMNFDFLFRFITPADGAYFYRANDIAVGYLLCGLLFLALAKWAKDQPRQAH